MPTCGLCDPQIDIHLRGLDIRNLCAKHKKERQRNCRRRYLLEKEHGITTKEYESMLYFQNGNCAICGEELKGTGYIDHNHVTGKNRGILCGFCNVGLGKFQDNVEILEKAYQYLVLHGC